MTITIDTTSMESLEACSEKIKAEIARIEKESSSAREKGTGKTKLVQKTSKKQKDILEEYVETYEGLLHLQRSVASFKGALVKKQKREKALEEMKKDEEAFEEALVADHEYDAAREVLEDERKTIQSAAETYENVPTEENRQRLEASRARIHAAYAAVERAKAEAERTMAKFDARFASIHESEAAVHDAKANFHDVKSGKKVETKAETVETVSEEDRSHTESVVEMQRKIAMQNFASVLAKRRDDLDSSISKKKIVDGQKVAAANDVAKVTANAAKNAEEAERRARIAYEQGLAAGRDFTKVMDHRASLEEATDEDLAKAEFAREAARRNNIKQGQRVAAASDVRRVSRDRAEKSAEAARRARIAYEQGLAAGRDVKKVMDHRAGEYSLSGDQVVQNLPKKTPLNEVFVTPGMSDAEIEESKKKLAAVPEGNATPTISWVDMKNRINVLMSKKENDDKNLTPDDIYALYFLRKHPEAAPSKEMINELLIWAGIVPLERTTPRTTSPAPSQENPKGPEINIIDDVPEKDKPEDKTSAEGTTGGDTTPKSDDMTDDEIEKAREEMTKSGKDHDDDMSDDEIDFVHDIFSGKKKEDTPKKGLVDSIKEKAFASKQKKVVKREKFFGRIKKKALIIRGLLFGERLDGRSDEYVKISLMICDLKNKYKSQSPEKNVEGLNNITTVIKSNNMDFEESGKLYGKLRKLSRKIEKYNKKYNKKNKKPEEVVIEPEEIEEENGFSRSR